MADIPSQLSFEHMLAHMFPGFFTALTVFMIFDILSPSNASELILRDSNAMIGFLGFVFVAGTILGVIIDGFHHRIIELKYFTDLDDSIFEKKNIKNECNEKDKKRCDEKDKNEYIGRDKNGRIVHIGSRKIGAHIKSQLDCENGEGKKCGECIFSKNYGYDLLKIYYAFDMDNMDKCIALHDYLRKSVYHYYEFYANTFIAMIPFTLVAPIYMVKILNIDLLNSFFVGLCLIFLTIACLDFAWMAYERWISVLYFAFCRCLEGKTLGTKKVEGHSFELFWK